LVARLVQFAHHGHQARVRHAVGRCAAKQDRLAIGELHVVRGQVQVQGARLAAETGRDPARQQIDGRDHPVTAVAVKNDGAGSERFHTGMSGRWANKETSVLTDGRIFQTRIASGPPFTQLCQSTISCPSFSTDIVTTS